MKLKILYVMPECYVDTNLIDFLLDKQYKTDISELTQIFGGEAQGIEEDKTCLKALKLNTFVA